MTDSLLVRHKLTNVFQSILLLGGMSLILGLLGYLLGGLEMMMLIFIISILTFIMAPRISSAMILRMYGARMLYYEEIPDLYDLLAEIAKRAGLNYLPRLYYIPSSLMNAITLGQRKQAVIGVTDGLLRELNVHEIAAVLAHEISHIKNKDIWIMSLADFISRVIYFLSMFGLTVSFIILVLVPSITMLTVLLILVFLPSISTLLQLALSRTREFNADLDAAILTGDPQSLAVALTKVESHDQHWMSRIFFPGHQNPQPSILRSHPPTQERVSRLMQLAMEQGQQITMGRISTTPAQQPAVQARPCRRRISGLWY